jgi:hypothetical protein
MVRRFFARKASWAILGVVAIAVAVLAVYFNANATPFSRSFANCPEVEQGGGTGQLGADDPILW